jgi:hypothetical protein
VVRTARREKATVRPEARRVIAAALFIAGVSSAEAQHIPAPKLELIKQATTAMNLDQRIRGLVAQRVEADVEDLRLRNPALSDSLAGVARAVIRSVYDEHLHGRDGLMSKVYAVLDRRLTEDDLKFAVNFKNSDQGKRYREVVPRVVQESLEAGRLWSERLEPEINRRLEDRLRGTKLNLRQ